MWQQCNAFKRHFDFHCSLAHTMNSLFHICMKNEINLNRRTKWVCVIYMCVTKFRCCFVCFGVLVWKIFCIHYGMKVRFASGCLYSLGFASDYTNPALIQNELPFLVIQNTIDRNWRIDSTTAIFFYLIKFSFHFIWTS